MSKKFIYICLIIIIGLGIFLRTYRLSTIPAYHEDEIAFGYSAYSILQTGADEYGKKLPIFLESFGDYKLALNAYVLIPFIKLFGLEEKALRIPAMLLGFASIILVYFFVKEVFNNKRLGLVSSILLLFSPWHIIFSRTSNEAILQVFLIICFFLFWIRFIKDEHWVTGILTVILSISAILAYYSSLVFLPIVACLFIFFFILIKKIKFKFFIPPISIILMIILIFFTQPLDRIKQTTFLNNEEIKAAVAENNLEQRMNNNVLVRFFNNKYYMGGLFFARNYFYHLNFDFLFLRGDRNYSRYSIPYTGVLYLWELPFILMGIFIAFKRWLLSNDKRYLFILGWFFSGFLASAIAFWDLNSQRSLVAIPSVQIIVGLGILGIYDHFKKEQMYKRTILIVLIGGLILYNFLLFVNRYFIHQLVREPWHRDGYAKEMVETLNQIGSNYSKVVVTDTSAQLFFFYNKTNPQEAQKILADSQKDALNFAHLTSLGTYLFMPIECPAKGKLGVLYVCRGEMVAYNTKIIKVIRYSTGQPARIFLVFTDPNEKVEHNEQDSIKIFKDTILNPQIFSASEQRYW